jgi:hypothetical protein
MGIELWSRLFAVVASTLQKSIKEQNRLKVKVAYYFR